MSGFKSKSESSPSPTASDLSDITYSDVKNVLNGTGITVTGLVTGYQSTKPRVDKESGEVSEARHYIFLACKDTPGVKVKLKREPDPSLHPPGTSHSLTVSLSVYNGFVYYAEL